MLRLILLLCSSLVAVTTTAHHAAIGLYDRNNVGDIDGELISVFWRNPHVLLEVSRTGDDGNEETWEIAFGGLNSFERRGITRDQLTIGDRVRVSGSLGRDGRTIMFANSLTFPNGEELALQELHARYGITEAAMADARNASVELREDIFRVWLPYSRPDTGAGNTEYPLTEAGRAAQAAWDPADDPALRCIPHGLPTAMDNPFPVEFVDQDDTVLMRLEEWDGVRTIFLDEANDGAPIQPYMGVSVGRFEGKTLFVETTDIAWRYVDNIGTPQSEDVVIVETFRLNDDGTRLSWEARITDSVNFTEPVVMAAEWIWLPDQELKPFDADCVPE